MTVSLNSTSNSKLNLNILKLIAEHLIKMNVEGLPW